MASRLLEEPPVKVEVRGGLVYFTHGEGEVYAQPVHAALRTSALVHAAVRRWRATEPGKVVPIQLLDPPAH